MAKENYEDGEYDLLDIEDALGSDFASERELCDYIENNIVEFCADCLGVQYLRHVREEELLNTTRKKRGNRRIDFVITTQIGERIGIEAKNPFYSSELSAAIGQTLSYLTLFEMMEKPLSRIIIVSTKIDSVLPRVISRFNLPIGFICMDKNRSLTYRRVEIRSGQ